MLTLCEIEIVFACAKLGTTMLVCFGWLYSCEGFRHPILRMFYVAWVFLVVFLHSQKKGTKAVTGAVPFQKVHFCTQRLHIGTLVVHIST